MPRPLTEDERWIVSHNLPMVEHYLRGRRYDHATWEDLRAAGYVGLCHAIRRYDPEIACWSTYARGWIRRCIQAEIQGAPLIRVPPYHLSNLKSGLNKVSKENNGPAARRAMNARYVRWDEGEAVAILAVTEPVDSSDDRDDLTRYLNELNDRQREIVQRIVMNGERSISVARDMGVSRQRVDSIRSRAIRLLRLKMIADQPDWILAPKHHRQL